MKKIKEYYICDRCFEELEKPNYCYDYQYCYHLCDRCKKIYEKYKKEIKLLEYKYDRITKNFKFGKYLPSIGVDKIE